MWNLAVYNREGSLVGSEEFTNEEIENPQDGVIGLHQKESFANDIAIHLLVENKDRSVIWKNERVCMIYVNNMLVGWGEIYN